MHRKKEPSEQRIGIESYARTHAFCFLSFYLLPFTMTFRLFPFLFSSPPSHLTHDRRPACLFFHNCVNKAASPTVNSAPTNPTSTPTKNECRRWKMNVVVRACNTTASLPVTSPASFKAFTLSAHQARAPLTVASTCMVSSGVA